MITLPTQSDEGGFSEQSVANVSTQCIDYYYYLVAIKGISKCKRESKVVTSEIEHTSMLS